VLVCSVSGSLAVRRVVRAGAIIPKMCRLAPLVGKFEPSLQLLMDRGLSLACPDIPPPSLLTVIQYFFFALINISRLGMVLAALTTHHRFIGVEGNNPVPEEQGPSWFQP
jgi:hypothetical protein